jgi:AraC-like DNA-binding protein/quercetin dioxygenase-like cupin family protein
MDDLRDAPSAQLHVRDDHGRIGTMPFRNQIRVGRRCREQFLPVRQTPRLRRHGVMLAGVSELTGTYLAERSDPPDHVLIYTLAGEGWVETESFTQPLAPGDLLVNPAGSPHRYGLHGGTEWRIAWVHLADTPEWSGVGDRGHGVSTSGFGEQLSRLILACVLDPHYDDVDDGAIARDLYARLLLHHLRREFHARRADHEREIRHRLSEVFARVNSSLAHRWTVAEMAALAFVSPVHFNRLCRQILGRTPMEATTRLRMERAAELLLSTDQTLAVIADQVGYGDAFAFSAAFRRWAGESPRAFRTQGGARHLPPDRIS